MSIEQIAWLIAAVFLAEIVVSLFMRRFFSTKSQIKFGEDLIAALNKARQDVLNASKVIEEVEGINLKLRTQNQHLNSENLRLENLLAEAKSQLHSALDDIQYFHTELKKVFPNWPDKGRKSAN